MWNAMDFALWYLFIDFFSAGGETKEPDQSKDTTLVGNKPNQGERSRRP